MKRTFDLVSIQETVAQAGVAVRTKIVRRINLSGHGVERDVAPGYETPFTSSAGISSAAKASIQFIAFMAPQIG
jgi:hypothetical protein